MAGKFGVALMTRKPFSAALELDRDDVAVVVIMSASRLIINVRAGDARSMDDHIHLARSRGQRSTRTDAIVQQAIIKMNPPRNEPLL